MKTYDVTVVFKSGGKQVIGLVRAADSINACLKARDQVRQSPTYCPEDPVSCLEADEVVGCERPKGSVQEWWLGMLLVYCLDATVWRTAWGWEAPVRKPVKQLRKGECGYNGGPAPEWVPEEAEGPKEWETLFRPAPYQRLKLAEV